MSIIPEKRRFFLLKQRLDTQQYLKCLKNVIPPFDHSPNNELVPLVHDHFPVHKAKLVQHWLQNHSQFEVLPWPRQSSDINIFEDVWEKMLENSKSMKVHDVFTLSHSVIELFTEISDNQD